MRLERAYYGKTQKLKLCTIAFLLAGLFSYNASATVCFITETGECKGYEFSNSSDFEGGGNSSGEDYDLNSQDRCRNEGYTVSSCPEGYKLGGKKCSYGPYYTECIEDCPANYVTCEDPFIGVGTACGGKYTSCTCASGYNWESGQCKAQAIWGTCSGYAAQCSLGDILFSDGTCSANKVSGKTPIAVVVYISSEGCGQALALNSLSGTYQWGGYGTDISTLPNLSQSQASQDFASCENSAKIRAQGNSSTYPAVWAAYNYTTTGTKVGDWCLPAAGIFTSIFKYQASIDPGFSRAGGTNFTDSTYVWSSSENYINGAWGLGSGFGHTYGLDGRTKGGSGEVRPVIGFCKAGYEYDKTTDSCKIRTCGYGYSKSLQSECLEYDTCQSGSTTYYRCTKCNPCSTMCGVECVKGYDSISKIGKYATYETCTYNGKTYYKATSCDMSVTWNRLDSSRGYCYESGGDNLPCGM